MASTRHFTSVIFFPPLGADVAVSYELTTHDRGRSVRTITSATAADRSPVDAEWFPKLSRYLKSNG